MMIRVLSLSLSLCRLVLCGGLYAPHGRNGYVLHVRPSLFRVAHVIKMCGRMHGLLELCAVECEQSYNLCVEIRNALYVSNVSKRVNDL